MVELVLVFLGKVLAEGMNCPGGVISIFLVTKIFFESCRLFFDLPGLHNAHADEIPVVSTSKASTKHAFISAFRRVKLSKKTGMGKSFITVKIKLQSKE